MIDLEFGGDTWRKKYNKLIKAYGKYKPFSKQIAITACIVTLALVVKWGLSNINRVVESGTGVAFEESIYTPLTLGELLVTPITDPVAHYPIKDSMVNRRMQQLNLHAISEDVRAFIRDTENICIPIKQFGVPFDIVVFHNVTMVNPTVVQEGNVRRNVAQLDINGVQTWASRATEVTIKHHDADLNYVYTNLYDNDAFCFAFYYM